MEVLNDNSILQFNKNQLHEVRKLFEYKNASDVIKAIDTLEDWIEKQNHFVVRNFDRNYLERLLLASKGSTERAKKHLDKICTARTFLPEFLKNFTIKKEFEDYFSVSYNFFLPKPTPEHYRVCVTKFYTENYDKFSLLDFYRYMILMVEYILNNDYAAGSVMIVDLEHINFSLISKVNPITVERGLSIIVGGYGMRVKAIYIINSSKLLDTLVTIIKQGLSEKLRNRLYILSSPQGLYEHIPRDILPSDYGGKEASIQKLHAAKRVLYKNFMVSLSSFVTIIKQGLGEKLRNRLYILNSPEGMYEHIPRDFLPSDYGGKEASIQKLHDQTFSEFCSDDNINRVKEMENAGTDETCRHTCKFNEDVLGMPGSFKSLNVD